MPRPTREGVGHTTDLIWHLADKDEDAYSNTASLVDLLVWLDGEIEAARHAAAYGSGASEVHVLGHGASGVEGRLNDALVKDLRSLRTRWRSQLWQLVCGWQDDARQAANWPKRT